MDHSFLKQVSLSFVIGLVDIYTLCFTESVSKESYLSYLLLSLCPVCCWRRTRSLSWSTRLWDVNTETIQMYSSYMCSLVRVFCCTHIYHFLNWDSFSWYSFVLTYSVFSSQNWADSMKKNAMIFILSASVDSFETSTTQWRRNLHVLTVFKFKHFFPESIQFVVIVFYFALNIHFLPQGCHLFHDIS